MMETIYKETENNVTRKILQKDAQKILDDHKNDTDAEMVESLRNIVKTMDKTFNDLSVFEYSETNYKNIESSIFTAIGTTVYHEANEVQKELKSLKDKLDRVMDYDRRFMVYRATKSKIEKLPDKEKIKFLAELYEKDPEQLEAAVKNALTIGNIDMLSPLLRKE